MDQPTHREFGADEYVHLGLGAVLGLDSEMVDFDTNTTLIEVEVYLKISGSWGEYINPLLKYIFKC